MVQKKVKKGITAVIAASLLMAITLALALGIGAYTIGVFGSKVQNVQLTSSNIYGGKATSPGANITFAFDNPGRAITITSFTMGNWTSKVSVSLLNSTIASGLNSIYASSFSTSVSSGSTYAWYIQLSNGQSMSGSLISQ